MVSITLEGLWMVSDRIVDFQFFSIEISQVQNCNNFHILNYNRAIVCKNVPNQAKIYHGVIKMVGITLEGLWTVSDRTVHFQFFVKFHRSGPAIIFTF